MKGLQPLFTIGHVQNVHDDYVSDIINKEIKALIYIGEQFVGKARITGNYTDRTGNLRSSIGYIIVNDGKVVQLNIQKAEQGTDGGTGEQEATAFGKQLASRFNKGLILIVFAGMEYAASVESKGYDVLTGSAPKNSEVVRLLTKIQNAA